MDRLPAIVDGLPNICGAESVIEDAIKSAIDRPVDLGESAIDLSRIRSAFAIALHMHQPLIPAGGPDLRTAEVIRQSATHDGQAQAMRQPYNAGIFRWCYKRMGEFIPQLVGRGKDSRG